MRDWLVNLQLQHNKQALIHWSTIEKSNKRIKATVYLLQKQPLHTSHSNFTPSQIPQFINQTV